jgi:hypothetical protein
LSAWSEPETNLQEIEANKLHLIVTHKGKKESNIVSIFSSTSEVHIAAKIATILFVLSIILQILLATGILPISMAWGGNLN